MASLPLLKMERKRLRIPIIGPSYAGRGSVFADEIVGLREIDQVPYFGAYDQVFCTPVVGDSLIGDDIQPDDWVIALKTVHANRGNLVVAHTNNGRTIKYVHFHPASRHKVILRSSNSNYADWEMFKEDVRILGVVLRVERDLLLDGKFVTEVVKRFPYERPMIGGW